MPTKVKIDFFVPGFSKCGTTTLCALLDCHPGIFIPSVKEPWYFSSPRFEEKHEDFNAFYADAEPGQLLCDGSTDYSGYYNEARTTPRIKANNPDCKFIFIARHPRSRIESSYREMHHSGASFGLDAPYALGECMKLLPQMVQDTLFWERISHYREEFGDERILVVFLEDLRTNQQEVLAKSLEHLGLSMKDVPGFSTLQLNAGSRKLHDSSLLRKLRNTWPIGPALAKINVNTQDRFLVPLSLRIPFGRKALVWDDYAEQVYREQIVPDSTQFLHFYGKSPSFWGMEA